MKPPSEYAISTTAYYDAQIRRMARGKKPDVSISHAWATLQYFARDSRRALSRALFRPRHPALPEACS